MKYLIIFGVILFTDLQAQAVGKKSQNGEPKNGTEKAPFLVSNKTPIGRSANRIQRYNGCRKRQPTPHRLSGSKMSQHP